MKARSSSGKGGVLAGISRLGQKRRVVIPKQICESLGLQEGDYFKVLAKGGTVILEPGKSEDPDAALNPREAAAVRRGESQLRRGLYVTLEQLEDNLDHKACQAGGKRVS